jgi:hypothetical protein
MADHNQEKTQSKVPPPHIDPNSIEAITARDALVSDGFQVPSLGAEADAPPAYGELHDQLQLSRAGLQAGAAVTGK